MGLLSSSVFTPFLLLESLHPFSKMSLRVAFLLVVLAAIAVSAAIFDDAESLEDTPQMDKRNFQYIWRNLPIGSGSLSDKRSMDGLSRDRASAFYRLG